MQLVVKLNILNRVAVIPMSLISISNGIVVPPLGPVRLMVARKDWYCSGTISGALSVILAPEDVRCFILESALYVAPKTRWQLQTY